MYFTNITNKELYQFHNKVKSNFNMKISEIINSPLFRVENSGDLLRIYPLFYTDKIVSSNSIDRILEDKCIISQNNLNTTLFFIVDEKIPVLSINYSFKTDYLKYWEFYIYDGYKGSPLSNALIHLIFKNNDDITSELDLYSDKDGVIYINTSEIIYDALNVEISVMDNTETFQWESE